MLKNLVRHLARSLGLDVYRRRTMPRGISLETDLLRLFGGRPLRLIFDVGANRGQTALHWHSVFREARIHSFEPVPATWEMLRANVQAHPRIHAHRLALGANDGSATMQITPGSGSNRILPPDAPATPDSGAVTLRRLDRFCVEQAIDRIDLLKTDCEGHDLQVLEGAAALLHAHRVACIYCEVNFRRDGRHGDFFAIQSLLAQPGYSFYALYDYSGWQYDVGQEGFANALFVSPRALPPRSITG